MTIRTLKTGFVRQAFFITLFLFVCPPALFAVDADEENTIEIYQRVNASVVNITRIAISYDFFLNPIPSESAGSGSIIDKRGYILTNYHVVRNSDRLEVTLSDGSKWPAELVGADSQTDIAIIQIKVPSERLTVIPLGNSEGLRPGQKVLAIGNPFGLERSLTTGIISAMRKHVKSGRFEMDEVIQTDAAINPGNSGGPLINSEGRVIGVNTAIFTPSGGSVGIGFSVPINIVKKNLNELITKGYVAYAWLGVDFQPLIPRFAEALSLPATRGLLVARVLRGGPGYKSGLRGGTHRVEVGNAILIVGGDLIVSMDGETTPSTEEFQRIMRQKKPGDRAQFTLWRGRVKKEVEVILGERPRE